MAIYKVKYVAEFSYFQQVTLLSLQHPFRFLYEKKQVGHEKRKIRLHCNANSQ